MRNTRKSGHLPVIILAVVIALVVASIAAFALPVFGDEAKTSVSKETETKETSTEGLAASTQANPPETKYNPKDGNCKLTVIVEVPDGFEDYSSDTINVSIQNDQYVYNIDVLPDNGFEAEAWVPEGDYQYVGAFVYGHNGEYQFNAPENKEFKIDTDGYILSVRLSNYDDYVQKDETDITAVADDIPQWRSVEGDPTGSFLRYDGLSTGTYNVVVRITHSGRFGEAKFQISFDGGKNWFDECLMDSRDVDLRFSNSEGNVIDTGLTMHFVSNAEYKIDSTYSFNTKKEHEVKHEGKGSGALYLCGDAIHSGEVRVRIVVSGRRGSGTYQLSGDGGETWSIEKVIPDNGQLAGNEGLTFIFSNGNYVEGEVYIAYVDGAGEPEDKTPVVLLIMGIVVVAFVLGLVGVLARKKTGKQDYDIIK